MRLYKKSVIVISGVCDGIEVAVNESIQICLRGY
jgi:hypothetical protein